MKNFIGISNLEELIKLANDFSITSEMREFFNKRTGTHINLVKKYCEKINKYDGNKFEDIVERGENHDKSKLIEPELTPYIYITWDHKCKGDDTKFDIPEDIRKEMDDASLHHIKKNRHHPEFHCSNDSNDVINASAMGDIDIAEMCLAGDTKVSLLDGSEVSIIDLVGKKEFWLYSCTPEGDIVPGRGHSARVTKNVRELVEVTLDNNKIIKCTKNHKFMLRDGSYKEAQDLYVGESLMPLYRKERNNYEQVYDLKANKWKFTHRIVVSECLGGYSSYVKKFGTNKVVCHHKNFNNPNNKKNNDPSNLEVMTRDRHYSMHSEKQRKIGSKVLKTLWKNKDFIERSRKRSSIIGKVTGPKNLTKYNKSSKHKKYASLRMSNINNENKKCRYCGRIFGNIGSLGNHIKSTHENDKKWKKQQSEKNSKIWENEKYKEKMRKISMKNSTTPVTCEIRGKILGNAGALGNHKKIHAKISPVNNHKIKNIEIIQETCEVYDLTVDTYHNFALSSGIFVHNCADWCAMSEELGNDPIDWADDNVNTKWKFSDAQSNLIYELLKAIW